MSELSWHDIDAAVRHRAVNMAMLALFEKSSWAGAIGVAVACIAASKLRAHLPHTLQAWNAWHTRASHARGWPIAANAPSLMVRSEFKLRPNPTEDAPHAHFS